MSVVVVDRCASTPRLLSLLLSGPVCVIPGLSGAFRAVAQYAPNVLLLDVCSIGKTPLVDAVRALHAIAPEADVVVITADPERRQARDAIGAGACGYVDKMDLAELRRLVDALRALRSSGGAVSSAAH
jgi:DNA-binding NarL/FixJ family response regulator